MCGNRYFFLRWLLQLPVWPILLNLWFVISSICNGFNEMARPTTACHTPLWRYVLVYRFEKEGKEQTVWLTWLFWSSIYSWIVRYLLQTELHPREGPHLPSLILLAIAQKRLPSRCAFQKNTEKQHLSVNISKHTYIHSHSLIVELLPLLLFQWDMNRWVLLTMNKLNPYLSPRGWHCHNAVN